MGEDVLVLGRKLRMMEERSSEGRYFLTSIAIRMWNAPPIAFESSETG